MKIVIPGGSGQIGTILARAFTRDGHEAVVLSRNPRPMPWRVVEWDGRTVGMWAQELDGADAVINLAGRSVDCRYGPENRDRIMRSRTDSVRAVAEAIHRASLPPRAWLQMSTATIYEHRYDAPNDEATGILGGLEKNVPDTWRFSISVAKMWELALREARTPKTRKILLRSAMVMSPDDGGVFDVLLRLVRHGLGGAMGDGRQYVSWIHADDFVRAAYVLISREAVTGPVNLASPNPLPNRDFMRAIRDAWGTRIGLPAPAWLLEIGAFFLRTESELVLKSRRVVPGRLVAEGFAFAHPEWREAAENLCAAWRTRHAT